MPKRGNTGVRSAQTTESASPSNEEDKWDEISNMKGKGESQDGFTKMNTNFFLRNGEEARIVFLDEAPFFIWGHEIQCRTDQGKQFWSTEQCQKSAQDHCLMCESDSKAISKNAKKIIFRILDERGSYTENGFDGVPAPKLFKVPLYLAKVIKGLKDDGGTLTDKVVKLKKDTNYTAAFELVKDTVSGAMFYKDAPEYDGELPEVVEVYAARDDDSLTDFVTKFSDAPSTSSASPKQSAGNSAGNSGRRAGSGTGAFD